MLMRRSMEELGFRIRIKEVSQFSENTGIKYKYKL